MHSIKKSNMHRKQVPLTTAALTAALAEQEDRDWLDKLSETCAVKIPKALLESLCTRSLEHTLENAPRPRTGGAA